MSLENITARRVVDVSVQCAFARMRRYALWTDIDLRLSVRPDSVIYVRAW